MNIQTQLRLVCVLVACALAGPACSSSSSGSSTGLVTADGSNDSGDAMCVTYYPQPGCRANPQTVQNCSGVGLACISIYCSCQGHFITGCDDQVREPWAYRLLDGTVADDGKPCDPNASAGDAAAGAP